MEAVKQGSATVGVKSATHAVLVALKRASSELAAHQKKIMPIDKHIAVSISGNGYPHLKLHWSSLVGAVNMLPVNVTWTSVWNLGSSLYSVETNS